MVNLADIQKKHVNKREIFALRVLWGKGPKKAINQEFDISITHEKNEHSLKLKLPGHLMLLSCC